MKYPFVISIIPYILVLFALCRAANVTVSVDDPRLITTPPGLWVGRVRYLSECGGFRWLDETGYAVSLTFVGTKVIANLRANDDGRVANIAIDGINVTQLDTWQPGISEHDCIAMLFNSGVLFKGEHTITITALNPSLGSGLSRGGVDLYGFLYDEGVPASSITGTPSDKGQLSTSDKISLGVGLGVGLGLGLPAAIAAVIQIRRWRREDKSSQFMRMPQPRRRGVGLGVGFLPASFAAAIQISRWRREDTSPRFMPIPQTSSPLPTPSPDNHPRATD